MAALTFDKSELGNLEYSLQREMLATDRRGGYMSTTIVCCNTRKYHGLIVSPINQENECDFVLLSSLDETIVMDGQRFNLALHRFKNVYEPLGHKYITSFEYTPTPTITYRVGDVVLCKELLWIHKRTQLMVRYTLVEGTPEELTLQLRPFLAFRGRHELSKANMYANGYSYPVVNGVKCKLYDGFPWLYMQTNDVNAEYVPAPDWYYDFEYLQEAARGYESHEDLLTTGYFEVSLKRGESVIFSASTDEMYSADTITEVFKSSIERRTHKVDFFSCLDHSARQFVVRRPSGKREVVAGYPWYGVIGREALFALPGLTLPQNHKEDCIEVLDGLLEDYMNGTLRDTYRIQNAVDTALWMYRTLQQLEGHITREEIWSKYGAAMMGIIKQYEQGEGGRVSLHENGLIWAWCDEMSLTWMDNTVNAASHKFRNGYHVEVNALWYNALCYTLDMAKEFGAKEFVAHWAAVPAKTKESFVEKFWHEEGWLADFVNDEQKNLAIRPNMIVACALNYKMVSPDQQLEIIRTVNQHLLTPRGLRSLTPRHVLYNRSAIKAIGGGAAGAYAYKNGAVWVWPLALYVKACFDIMGVSFLREANEILGQFSEEIQSYGIGSISEYFDADPPYKSRGAISQAWSVSSILEICQMVKHYEAQVVPTPKKRTRKPAAAKTTTAKKTTTTAAKKPAATKRVAKKPAKAASEE